MRRLSPNGSPDAILTPGGAGDVARRWTPAEDERLRSRYADGVPLAELTRDLGRSADAVVARRSLLGIPVRREPRGWTSLQDQFLRAAAMRQIPATLLAARLGRPVEQVRARRRQLGLAAGCAMPGRPARRSTRSPNGWDAARTRCVCMRRRSACITRSAGAGGPAPRTSSSVTATARDSAAPASPPRSRDERRRAWLRAPASWAWPPTAAGGRRRTTIGSGAWRPSAPSLRSRVRSDERRKPFDDVPVASTLPTGSPPALRAPALAGPRPTTPCCAGIPAPIRRCSRFGSGDPTTLWPHACGGSGCTPACFGEVEDRRGRPVEPPGE